MTHDTAFSFEVSSLLNLPSAVLKVALLRYELM